MPTFRRTLAATLAAIVAALLFALAPAATAKPKPPQTPPRPERLIDPATESDPSSGRCSSTASGTDDVRLRPGSKSRCSTSSIRTARRVRAIHSDPAKNTEQAPTGHSEWRALRIMRPLGIDTNTVDKTLSELETCNRHAPRARG